MAKKKTVKKPVQKKAKKKTAAPVRSNKTEIVVRVQPQQFPVVPTVTDLSEPMRDGKKLTIPKTWLTDTQIIQMVQRTPPQHIYRRAGKGGQEFSYVTGSYVEKSLNFVFAWNWDFEVVSHGQEGGFIWVLGKLTVRGTKPGDQIVKSQFGRAEIKYLKNTKNMLDFGNDLKAATTDALKKCASLLGIAGDIYGKSDYKTETGREPKEPTPPTTPAKDVTYDKTDAQEAPEEGMIVGPDGKPTHVCSVCGDPITKQGYQFSKKVYKKALCRDCVKEISKK